MKIISLLLSLCLASVALAEDPAELERLRHFWEQSVAQEMERKNNVYLKALEKLQKKFTVANNLAAAVAVNDEIKMVKLLKPEQKGTSQKRVSPLDGAWVETPGNYLKAIKGDKMVSQDCHVAVCSIKNNVLTMRDGNNVWIMNIDPDNPDVMVGMVHGRECKWTRPKW
jgi:hypothetical protein